MKITVITGSPHKNGASALFADEFIRGAEEAGHEIFRFDAAFEEVAACTGCLRCRAEAGVCSQKDAMEKLNPRLLEADAVVFVTPLYFFGMSAQLKAVIDRLYANLLLFKTQRKTAALLVAGNAPEAWKMLALASHYQTLLRYMSWSDSGMLLASRCGTRGECEQSEYPAQAYRMGLGIKI